MFNFAPLSKPILSSEKCASYSSKGTPTFKDQSSDHYFSTSKTADSSPMRKPNICTSHSPMKSLSKRHNFMAQAIAKSDLRLKETKLMSFCQDEAKQELNPEVTPCKTSPVQKIENRISRRERSSSPKLKHCNRDIKLVAATSSAD